MSSKNLRYYCFATFASGGDDSIIYFGHKNCIFLTLNVLHMFSI